MALSSLNLITMFQSVSLRRIVLVVTLTLVLFLSMMQSAMSLEMGNPEMATQPMSHAEHALGAGAPDNDAGAHDMSQACFMVCTPWTVTGTEISAAQDQYSMQIQFWTVETRASFRPESPKRPPRAI